MSGFQFVGSFDVPTFLFPLETRKVHFKIQITNLTFYKKMNGAK